VTKIRDRDQIVDTAARLFAEKGYESTSLDDVAAELGTARSALYYHVSGKAELRALIQIRRVKMLVDEASAVATAEGTPSQKLAELVRVHIRHFERFYPESRMWSEITSASAVQDAATESLHEHQRAFTRHLRDVIEDGIATDEFRPTNSAIAALGIIGMCHYLTTWYREDGKLTTSDIADIYAEMAVRSLRKL
jgi:TetR/AcrR family transcriptional regulator, cholesterol catabolism regulator